MNELDFKNMSDDKLLSFKAYNPTEPMHQKAVAELHRRRELKEAETLSVAEAANRTASSALSSARRSNKIAISAIIIAVSWIIIQIIFNILKTS